MVKLCYSVIFLFTLLACERNNELNESSLRSNKIVNNVFISGINENEDYVVAENGRVFISPTIKREYEQTEQDLAFEWVIEGERVAESKNLDVALPNSGFGKRKKGKFNVLDTKSNKQYSVDFNLAVTNPFGYGFYFLSVNDSGESLISHINVDTDTEMVFHSSFVGGTTEIGDNAHSLQSYAFYDGVAGRLAYRMFITSEKGDMPHLVTQSPSLPLLEAIPSNYEGLSFSPKMHILGHNYEKRSHFIADSYYMLYENSVLRPKENSYKFYYIIPGNNDRLLYACDSTKGTFCVIDTQNNYSIEELYGGIAPGKIIGHKLRNYYENGKIKEEVTVMLAQANKTLMYRIVDNEIKLSKTYSIAGTASCAIHIDTTRWLVSIGNIVFRYNESTNQLASHYTLDRRLGAIEKIAFAKKSETLIIAVYNSLSTKTTKTTIVIVDKNLVQKNYPEVIYSCKGIACCDAKEW